MSENKKQEDGNTESNILKLSVSRVKTFKQCPRKYYYNYIEKLPRKDWPHFDLGTLVHGALENFHDVFRKDASDINLKGLMKQSFKHQRDEMEKKKTLSNETLLEARDLLLEYLKTIESEGIGSDIICLEEEFDIPLSEDVHIIGFIDRLDLDNDGIYHIKDYKTNKNMKYMEPFQLNAYGIYLLDKYPDIDYYRSSYIMMRFGGKAISYDFNKEDVEKCKLNLLQYAEHIREEGKWSLKPSRLCDWCDFKDPCLNTWW